MSQQQTLSGSRALSGLGLHGGSRVNMTLLPAPPNSGIRFRRVDLDGKPEIEATVENVAETNRSTTLSKGSVKVHTVEHVMAALAGLNVDNAIVELDSSEPPIADGSSQAFSKLIESVGLVAQTEKREVIRVTEPFELQIGESHLSVFPHDRLKISCTSSDKNGRFTQFHSVELSPETWVSEIAPARTFCFYEEIEYLIRNGLIKGGSLENAVIIRDDAVLTTEPLRYADEFVRHKILDIIGDLYLMGRPLAAHVVAIRPSHAANCELARQIMQRARKSLVAAQTFTPPPSAVRSASAAGTEANGGGPRTESSGTPGIMDVLHLMKLLPHRYPFLMVDRVTRIEGSKITAIKNVTINEPYFQGHFPGHPIMPGVLQLEAMAQVAGILMLQQAENAGKIAYFMSAEKVKWRRPVRPGDTVTIEIEMTKTRGKIGRAKGVCTVAGEVVSEGEVTFMLTDG